MMVDILMRTFNIMLIGSTFSGGEREHHLAHALRLHGNNVYHITNVPVFVNNNKLIRVRKKQNGVIMIEVPNPRRILPWKGLFMKIIIETINSILFIMAIIKNYSIIRDVDLIYSMGVHPFSDFVAIFFKKIKKTKLFIDVCDPIIEALDTIKLNKFLCNLLKLFGKAIFKNIFSFSEGIITHTNSMKSILQKYTDREKIHVVYNPINIKTFCPIDREDALIVVSNKLSMELRNKFVILYTGMIGPFQDLGRVLSAAELLKDSNNDILFVLIGEGEDKERLIAEAARRGLSNVVFMDYQPWNIMPYVINSADVCVLPLKAHPLLQIALPKKFFEYAACGKPIICFCPEGEATELVKRWNAGVAVPPDDVKGFAREVKRLSLNRELVREMGVNARKMVEAMFSPEKVGEELSGIFSKALSVDREVQCI